MSLDGIETPAAGTGSIDQVLTVGDRQIRAQIMLTDVTGMPIPIPPPTRLNVRDYGAIGNGIADDRAAIQKALDAATAGQTVYVPAGAYLIGSGLAALKSGVQLLGDGDSSRLIHGMRQGIHVGAPGVAVSNVGIKKLCFYGAPGKWALDGNGVAHAILADGARYVTVEDCLLVGPGNGVYQSGAGTGAANGLFLTRVRVEGWGSVGFGLGDGAVVTDCTLTQDDPKDAGHGSHHGIYCHNGIENASIKNTKVVNARGYGLHCYGEATGLSTGPLTISGCTFQGCFGSLIVANYPAEAARVQFLVIQNSQFLGCYGGDSVVIKQGDGVQFTGNVIDGAPNSGLSVGMWRIDELRGVLRNATFTGNTIKNCAYGLLAGVPEGHPGSFDNCRIQGTTFFNCPRTSVIYEAPGLLVAA